MFRVLFLISSLLSGVLAAQELTSDQLNNKERRVIQALEASHALDSPEQLDAFLANFNGDDQVVAISVLLTRLAHQNSPTEPIIAWVKGYTASLQRIYTRPIEHPEKRLEVVNLQRQAKSTLSLWAIAKRQQTISLQWQSGNWQWPEKLDAMTHKAIINWIDGLTAEQANGVALHLLVQGTDAVLNDTKLVSKLALQSGSTELFEKLWALPPDQNSYIALANVLGSLSEEQSIDQLERAMEQPKLASQALLAITKHYGHHQRAQKLFIQAMESKDLAWHAASASKNIKDASFKRSLEKVLKMKDSGAARYALKNMQQGAEQ